MRVFLFELKKIAWTKKFLVILLILFCSVAFLFIRNSLFADYAQEQKMKELTLFIETSASHDFNYTNEIERFGSNEETERKQALNLKVWDLAKELANSFTAEEWKSTLTIENSLLIAIRNYKATGEDYPISEDDISYKLARNHTLLELGIAPEYENYSTAFPNFLKQVVDVFINYGGLLIALLLVGEIVTREFENNSIRLLFTLPLSRAKLFWSKYVSALTISFFTFIFVIAVGMLVGKLFGTDGSFAYPVLIEKEGQFFYMPTMDYILYVILLFAIMLLFVTVLYVFYSLVFKHLLATLAAIVATLAGGYQLGNLINWAPFSWVNPFQYIFPQEAILYQNNELFYQGIPVTLLLTLLLLVISIWRMKQSFD
ncbi:ABC transporter permease [Oceanobacillus jordanicus]|uniref:ABC transporter permease n=1 Tax=Oceanobacillus jordanicus TaxID=2867266 RepID=A0AAW5B8V6_9BACI|nr:ABC transporter permease subunit [Oceanobacillus jordanicus]MCG3421044.1 ABC transporter permease [Oceanobacillus jordanicus]